MYINDSIVENLVTNWGEKISIHFGVELSEPDEFEFYIETETLKVSFTYIVENQKKFLDQLFEKLKFYLPHNKDFLLSLNEKSFDSENPIEFPEKTESQKLIINANIKNFVKKGKKNKFKDYADLKSGGKDQFSSMKLEKLKTLIDNKVIDEINLHKFDDKHQSIAYRWVLRGLPVDMAIHKVKVDLEILNNIFGNYEQSKK